jgi:hypothetical protein
MFAIVCLYPIKRLKPSVQYCARQDESIGDFSGECIRTKKNDAKPYSNHDSHLLLVDSTSIEPHSPANANLVNASQ